MQSTQQTDNQRQQVEPIYFESTLLRVFGVLFCHDPKRARARTGTVEINRGVAEKGIAVRFDPEYAQPGPFAHKVAMAIIRKQSRFGRPAQNSISFSQRELMRMTGRKSMGGKQSDELALALKQIRYSHVVAHFKTGESFVEHDFSIFNEVLIERRASRTDPIVACTIVIADPIIQSLNYKHFTCLNHALMQQLGTIGAAFYMRLFYHFATLYDGSNLDRVVFRKRYDDICDEWLGGIVSLKHRSKILGEQLGKHLDRLVALKFLRSYELTSAEGREGFILSFKPGEQFNDDYRSFYARRPSGNATFKFHNEEEESGEPHRLAYLFMEKRFGRKPDAGAFVSSREVETARELLGHFSLAEMPAFLNYALEEARQTRFDPQTLGGVRQYVAGYQHLRNRQTTDRVRTSAKQAERQHDRLQMDYDEYRRIAAQELFESLPARERLEIEALTRAKFGPDGPTPPYMAAMLIQVERLRLTVQRYPDRIQTSDQWLALQPA